MEHKLFDVLFLGSGNTARSIIAEAILRRAGIGKFRSFSAGLHPKGEVHPYALQLLKGLNYETSWARPKGLEEFTAAGAPHMDFVFTVCDEVKSYPSLPGEPMVAHWGVPDPAVAEGAEAEKHFAFAETYRMLHNRTLIFTSLPMTSLDKLALQERLHEIGGG